MFLRRRSPKAGLGNASGMENVDDDGDFGESSGECHMCLAIPGKIIEISADNPETAIVDVVSVRRKVDLALLQDNRPQPGDWVLIHVGFAMSKISEQDALDQMQTLRILGEAEAAMQEVRGYGLADEADVDVS